MNSTNWNPRVYFGSIMDAYHKQLDARELLRDTLHNLGLLDERTQ